MIALGTTRPILLSCSFLRPLRAELGESVDTAGWASGPAPFLESSPLIDVVEDFDSNPFFRSSVDDPAGIRSQEKRERYFQNRMRSLLYPPASVPHPDEVSGRRSHSTDVIPLVPWRPRQGARGSQSEARVFVICREHLRLSIPEILPSAEYVAIHLIVEMPLGNDPFASLANARSTISSIDKMAALGVTIRRTPGEEPPVRGCVHLAFPGADDLQGVLVQHADADGQRATVDRLLERWRPEDLAMSLLAGRQTLSEKAPDLTDPRIVKGTVYLSYDWRAYVARNGFTFLGLTGSGDPGNFHSKGRSLAKSMYFDALLLGQIQLDAANRIADSVVQIRLSSLDVTETVDAERRLLAFRSKVWWSHVTEQAEIVNALLTRYQRQHNLPDLVAQFNQDLTDLSRFQSLRHDSRTNRAIGLLTAVFLAPTIVLAFASIYVTSNSWLTVTLSAAAAIASGAGAYVLWGAFMNRRIKGGQ